MNTTSDATFAVDVPAGMYQVTLVLGDHGKKAHDQMGVFLEGTQVDSVTTAAGATVTKATRSWSKTDN